MIDMQRCNRNAARGDCRDIRAGRAIIFSLSARKPVIMTAARIGALGNVFVENMMAKADQLGWAALGFNRRNIHVQTDAVRQAFAQHGARDAYGEGLRLWLRLDQYTYSTGCGDASWRL